MSSERFLLKVEGLQDREEMKVPLRGVKRCLKEAKDPFRRKVEQKLSNKCSGTSPDTTAGPARKGLGCRELKT